MKKMKYPLLAIALVFLAYCKSTKTASVATAPVVKEAYTPSAKQLEVAEKRWAGTVSDEITQGQHIYMTKCSECHAVFDIMEFGEKKWIHEIDKMAPKAKLTPEEKLKLTKHILSYREANAVVKSN